MKTILRAALVAALMAGGSAVFLPASSADAQVLDSLRNRQKANQTTQQQQRGQQLRIGDLSAEESQALYPIYQAAQAQDWNGVRAALPAARSGASSPGGKFLVGQIMFQLARATQDSRLEAEAITQMIQSGGASAEQLAELQRVQSDRSFNSAIASGNTAAIEAQLQQRLAATPNDTVLILQLARAKARSSKHAEAVDLLRRAVQLTQAANQTVPVEWRRDLAVQAHSARSPDTIRYFREWLAAAPSPAAWHDTLAVFAEANGSLQLDTYRLMRAARAMTSERDFIELGEAANEARAFGEVAAVLQEGLNRNLITTNAGYARERLSVINGRLAADRASLPTEKRAVLAGRDGQAALRLGDAYYGYGQYAEAAELYRAALAKGVDAGLANTRLGAALALAGQRAEAERAFQAVTGARAELASLWMLWLQSRG